MRGLSTVDVEKILQSDDLNALRRVVSTYAARREWMDVLRRVKDGQDSVALFHRGLAESALAAMDERGDPVVSAVDALRVEQRVIELAKDMRWTKILDAREDGAGWDEIAAAVGMVGDHAGKITRDWYVNRIAALKESLPGDEFARAESVVDDPPEAEA